jgi:hypothetical protein
MKTNRKMARLPNLHRPALLLFFCLLSEHLHVSAFRSSTATRILSTRIQKIDPSQNRFLPFQENRGLLQHINGDCEREKNGILGRFSSKWKSLKQTCGRGVRPKTSQPASFQEKWREINCGRTSGRQRMLSLVGIMFATLLVHPVKALAMGGGMGGPKGPIEPMTQ